MKWLLLIPITVLFLACTQDIGSSKSTRKNDTKRVHIKPESPDPGLCTNEYYPLSIGRQKKYSIDQSIETVLLDPKPDQRKYYIAWNISIDHKLFSLDKFSEFQSNSNGGLTTVSWICTEEGLIKEDIFDVSLSIALNPVSAGFMMYPEEYLPSPGRYSLESTHIEGVTIPTDLRPNQEWKTKYSVKGYQFDNVPSKLRNEPTSIEGILVIEHSSSIGNEIIRIDSDIKISPPENFDKGISSHIFFPMDFFMSSWYKRDVGLIKREIYSVTDRKKGEPITLKFEEDVSDSESF